MVVVTPESQLAAMVVVMTVSSVTIMNMTCRVLLFVAYSSNSIIPTMLITTIPVVNAVIGAYLTTRTLDYCCCDCCPPSLKS